MLTFRGLANASAAVALDGRHFILADDEERDLFLFDLEKPDSEPSRIELDIGNGEPDLEGAAMLDDRIWWIASHNFDGQTPEQRRRLFATDVIRIEGHPSLRLAGPVHRTLLDELARQPAVAEALDFGGKRWKEIDIEGLATTPGNGLMLGFRAPLREDRAILVEITNPAALAGSGAPVLADPVYVDLGGRGIRSLECVNGGYLIVGGKVKGKKKPKLYFWSGQRGADPVALDTKLPDDFNPEAVFQRPGTSTICLISDDGRRDGHKDRFRALLLDLDELLR